MAGDYGHRLRRLFADRRGHAAMLFSLLLFPIAGLSGAAVDFHQAMSARSRLADALDAAALAVGASPSISDQDADTLARDFLNANFPDGTIGSLGNVTVALNHVTDRVTVTGESQVSTAFLGLIGIDTLTVHWETEVARARQTLELAMVLDNTGSMSGSKISALRDAAALLTEILFDNADDPQRLRIEDEAPDPTRPETLFVPYFAPDEPSYFSGFSNSYMADGMGGYDLIARLSNSLKYAGVNPSGDASNWGCTARPITPLTSNRNTIDSAISQMIASGTTNIPIGVSWGVRILSPEEPFVEGAAWDDDETIKAMVILTDGENVINGRSNINLSDYSGYGYAREVQQCAGQCAR